MLRWGQLHGRTRSPALRTLRSVPGRGGYWPRWDGNRLPGPGSEAQPPRALKVLRPDLASLLGPERFLREIQIEAGLQHINILPVHDSGEADEIEVAPRVKKAKKVTWTCEEYDWEVEFKEPGPLVEGHFGGKANQEKGSQIRADAEPGGYRYTVIVFIDGEPLSKDPELMVDE